MVTSSTASLPRCGAVWLLATATAGALVGWLAPVLAAGPDPVRLDRTLVWVCAAAAVAVGVWLWLVTALVAVEALTGHTGATPGIPAPVRRVVLAACGIALVGALAAPAVATPGHPRESRGAVSLAGLPLPDRAVSALPGGAQIDRGRPAAPRAVSTMTSPEARVVVRPGDSLWAIASRDLGSRATNAEIAARWQQVYDLNRDAIGSDPDVIQPATRLQLPHR